MFFKKKEEAFFERMEEKLKNLEDGIAAGNRQSEELTEKIGRLQTTVQKHDMAMEDLLEEWEEKRSDEKEVKERFRELEQNESRLLALFETYQEQFWSLKRFADTKDQAWSDQIALMEQSLDRCRRLCGIDVIDRCGEMVDYDLHEVIQITETKDAEQDRRVADIYGCGYLYRGKVKKKAKVAVYQMTGQEK